MDRSAPCLDRPRRPRPRPQSIPIRVRFVDCAASAPSLWGEVRQRPECLHGAPDPAAARTPAAAAPAACHPVRSRCRAAVERRRVPPDPSSCPGVGSHDRLRRRVRPSCAERVRAHLGPVRSEPRRAGGQRAGRYAPAIARSWPAASRGSPSSSRNPIAAARRRIGAFLRGSVTLTESSLPRCRQELTSTLQ